MSEQPTKIGVIPDYSDTLSARKRVLHILTYRLGEVHGLNLLRELEAHDVQFRKKPMTKDPRFAVD